LRKRERRKLRNRTKKRKGRKGRMNQDKDFEERKKILEEIKKFNRTELETLYTILIEHNESLSENKNGIFFDLMNVKRETIDTIRKLVEFSTENRISFESREKEMSSLSATLHKT
jgi:hypothetical protein